MHPLNTVLIKKPYAFFFLFLFLQIPALSSEKLTLYFFGSSTCEKCLEIKQGLLFPLADEFPEKLEVIIYNFDNEEAFQKMISFHEKYGVTNEAPQELFFPDTVLLGAEKIMTEGEELIRAYLADSTKWVNQHIESDTVNVSSFLKNKTSGWAFFLGTLVAGLADGVNPCAIATMIFLISFLATQKRKRSEILIIGLAYTGSVYITYFAMGLGFREVLDVLKGKSKIVADSIRWAAFVAASVIAILSFRDAFMYARTKKTKDIALQLPKAVKMRIHKVISGHMSGTGLIIGSVITGFLVTLLEAICTGQMYLPYIVAMTTQSELRIWGIIYLAFYNFLFVLPLLVVMVLAFYGMKWNDLAKRTQKNMVLLKIILGLVMVALAVYLIAAG